MFDGFDYARVLAMTDQERRWLNNIKKAILMELCEHVHRLYHEAFRDEVPRPLHWSKYGGQYS
ncbi:MAG: hypothetical protein ACREHD_22625 [Pirellulales bacterium]